MRKGIFLFILVLFVKQAYNQDLKYESLILNSAPAYNILGVDPQNIETTNSPHDFAAAAQSAVIDGKLQPNFALETTPALWGKKSASDKKEFINKYLEPKKRFSSILNTLTFSFATSSSDTFRFGSLKQGTGFGFGLHTMIYKGRISKSNADKLLSLRYNKYKVVVYASLLGSLQTSDKVDLDKKLTEDMKLRENIKDVESLELFLDLIKVSLGNKNVLTSDDIQLLNSLIERAEKIEHDNLVDLNSMKYPLSLDGFSLSLDIADGGVVESNILDRRNIFNAKTAFWLTPSYRFNIKSKDDKKNLENSNLIDWSGVVRYTINRKPAVDSTDYLDAGMKVQYLHNKFSISGEYIARFLTKKPETVKSGWTYRLDTQVGYKLSDLFTFKTTIGVDFDGNSVNYSENKKLFILGGFSFGFSSLTKN